MVSEYGKQAIAFSMLKLFAIASALILVFVLIFVISEGIGVISWNFLASMWSHQDIAKGGIFPAIIGTLMLGLLVAVASIPIGILTAIYLNEYAGENLLTRVINLSIRNLAGVPSIVYGLFGLAFFVSFLNFGTSLLAAGLTLGCMTLPWIITASVEALRAVPNSFREGSYALGATKWETVRRIVLRESISGMMTASILGISRAMGETAPIILVGATFYISYLPTSPADKFMALPYHLFILATQHSSPQALRYSLGIALVLLALIFLTNAGMFYLRHKLRGKKDW